MNSWKANLYSAVAVQVMVTATFHIVTPFLPFYIAELGITGAGELSRWSGFLLGITSLFTGLLSPFWGHLSDRYGRKPMLIRSAASIALFTFCTSLATNIYQVLIFRILQGSFSGFSPAAMSLIATSVPENYLGYSLGLLQAGQVLGFLLGPLLGGILSDFLPYRRVLQLGSLMAVMATLLASYAIHERFEPRQPKENREATTSSFFSWPSYIWVMFTVIFLSQFATRGVEPLLPLYVRTLVGSSTALNTFSGVAVAVQGISSVLGAALAGRLAPRAGYKRLLILNLLCAALFYLPQGMTMNIWLLMSLRFIQGFFLGGLLPLTNSLIGLLTPAEKRGSVYGLTSSAFFFGNFSGPLVAGFWSAHFGLQSVFYVAAALLIVNLIWVLAGVCGPAKRGDKESGLEGGHKRARA
ncbi:MFS transporter [Neomoorella mulderi]|uniref:Inner membrane transport protein YnfM n=1 Tax=Moorella mulderi DSM 14980 TaxID=1122241 RepID=A0A151AW11_9FIRM|nr:MFS transporter [Moorella mulderi]KYH31859.1 inner membrane transport protein YnfM [Moorella mulderi DSM 14980]